MNPLQPERHRRRPPPVFSPTALNSTLVSTASSYLSASDPRVHFGLGRNMSARLLEITWPSGVVQRAENLSSHRLLDLREPKE